MAPTIHTPVEGYTGTVAGVHFVDGVGVTDDPAALLYFEGAGYGREYEPNTNPPDDPAGAGAEGDGADESTLSDPSVDAVPDGVKEDPDKVTEPPTETNGVKLERPHPVRDNAATWFDYLTALKPDHGLELGTPRADLISAANLLDGTE